MGVFLGLLGFQGEISSSSLGNFGAIKKPSLWESFGFSL
jgi:hypothetical protein